MSVIGKHHLLIEIESRISDLQYQYNQLEERDDWKRGARINHLLHLSERELLRCRIAISEDMENRK